MAELGIISATGMTSVAKLIGVLRDEQDIRIPVAARSALLEMATQIEKLTTHIDDLDTRIVASVRADDAARRLTTIPGVGPIIAATVRAAVQDPGAFPSARDLAAWIGLTHDQTRAAAKKDLDAYQNEGTNSCENC